MLKVTSSGEIQLTRGDTAWLSVDIADDEGNAYEIQSDDVLTLTVKKNYEDTEPLIEKQVTGTALFHIKPEDTAGLAFGKYKYDVQVETAAGDVYTVIADKTFVLGKEVSR